VLGETGKPHGAGRLSLPHAWDNQSEFFNFPN
jgi:hypothetical protein